MDHKHIDKEDGESFGMLWVHKKYWEKVKQDKKRFTQNEHANNSGATANV